MASLVFVGMFFKWPTCPRRNTVEGMPPARTMVQRILWKEDENGSMTGNGYGESFPLTLESGTTTHLEYGSLGETE